MLRSIEYSNSSNQAAAFGIVFNAVTNSYWSSVYQNNSINIFNCFDANPTFAYSFPQQAAQNGLEEKQVYGSADMYRGLIIEDELIYNLNKLKDISMLEHNWNEYGAEPLNSKLIRKVENVLIGLREQPEVFPTAANSIQLEYDGENGSYLEIQVYENRASEVFRVDKNGVEREWIMEPTANNINEVVSQFYE